MISDGGDTNTTKKTDIGLTSGGRRAQFSYFRENTNTGATHLLEELITFLVTWKYKSSQFQVDYQ